PNFAGPPSVDCLELSPNSTTVGSPPLVLTQTPVDIGTVSGKELGFSFAFNDASSTAKFQTIMFLRENSTIDLSPTYSPFTDNQVVFLISYDAKAGSGTASIGVFER